MNELAHTLEQLAIDQGRDAEASGRFVSSFTPVTVGAKENAQRSKEFEDRFIMTMKDNAKSALSTDVYHDGNVLNLGAFISDADEYESLDSLLNRNAWKAVNNAKATHDQDLIDTALDDDLVNMMEGNSFHMISYGTGPNGTASDKEGRIIARIIASGKKADGLTGIDVNRTFVSESSTLLGDKFSIPTRGIQGEFVWGAPRGLPEIIVPEGVTKVVAMFGNTAFNAANYNRDGKNISYRESVENFFSKMNVQNGLGHYLILSVDTDQNTKSQERRYAVTKEHEGLILTPFAIARLRGVIDRPYPIYAHWKMAVRYDQKDNTVLMLAESKKDHVMPISNGRDVKFAEGEQRVIMASHKWPVHEHTSILTRSGYEICKVFEAAHNPHKLILARATSAPRFEPF